MADRVLTSKDVFAYFRPDQMNKLSSAAETFRLSAGEMVYRKGEPADYFFVLVSGEVALRLPGQGGLSILIDRFGKGSMFGRGVPSSKDAYACNAQCVEDSEVLRIRHSVLKELMDKDLVMGYAIQSMMSAIYFGRYLETMKKLQAIVMNIPTE